MPRKAMIKLPGFAGVEVGGGGFRIPAGDYAMKCTGVTEETSRNDNEMLVFRFEGIEGKAKGRSFRLHCALVEKAYWKLRQVLEALGVECPDDPSDLDPEDVIGVEVIGTVADNEYEGKINSRLEEIRSAEGTIEDAPAKTATKDNSKKKKQQTYAASEVEDMDEDELFEVNEKCELGLNLDAHKTTRKKQNAVIAALQSAKMLEA